MRKVFLETHILLSDFYYRFPEYALQRNPSPESQSKLETLREKVHENLIRLSLDGEVQVCSSVPALCRFASVLSESKIPKELVLEEMQHWLSNLNLLDVKAVHFEKVLEILAQNKADIGFDEVLTQLICAENGVGEVLWIS